MKKIHTFILLLSIVVSLTSCYNTKVAVGDVKVKGPTYKVNSEWNHHLLWGLVPLNNAHMNGSEYVDGRADYVVKTNVSFLNGLVSFFTLGIYSPSTTTYYLPVAIDNTVYGVRGKTNNQTDSYEEYGEILSPPELAEPSEPKKTVYTIYFKNGSNIKTDMLEKTDTLTKVRMPNGKIANYRNSDIARVVKSEE